MLDRYEAGKLEPNVVATDSSSAQYLLHLRIIITIEDDLPHDVEETGRRDDLCLKRSKASSG
jgi:hypothetical protein